MRQQREGVGYLSYPAASRSRLVEEYEEKFQGISRLLDANPKILTEVDRDLKKLSRPNRRGRRACYSSEILLRSIIVQRLLGTSLRKTEIELTHNEFLRGFIRLGHRARPPSFSLLDRALKAIQPTTWERVNATLTQYAVGQGEIDPSEIRVDTTLVETNIRFPTDSSLLWDSFRTLLRLFNEARAYAPGLIPYRFHDGKVKKLHLMISRYASSPSKKRQRKVQKARFRLIGQVVRITQVAMEFVATVPRMSDIVLEGIATEIRHYLPLIAQALDVAQRVWIGGEVVPASQRIFSLFEPHTELIKRGRRHKPVEFGHMICLGQTREKFITQYDVMEKKVPDCLLPERIVEEHTADFGLPPKMMAGDRGFCGKPEAMETLRKKVKVVAIPQRLKDFADDAFVALQHFRSGIEGTISVLKRVFGLLRCPLRGFNSFAAHVGLGVFCHNLVILATSPP